VAFSRYCLSVAVFTQHGLSLFVVTLNTVQIAELIAESQRRVLASAYGGVSSMCWDVDFGGPKKLFIRCGSRSPHGRGYTGGFQFTEKQWDF